jgi:hypothetical protein
MICFWFELTSSTVATESHDVQMMIIICLYSASHSQLLSDKIMTM